MLLARGSQVASEQAISRVELQKLVRELFARAQAFGRSGDFDRAMSTADAAEGLALRLEVQS